jgi:hypothetical protein
MRACDHVYEEAIELFREQLRKTVDLDKGKLGQAKSVTTLTSKNLKAEPKPRPNSVLKGPKFEMNSN